ncbi:MAG: ABC transporter ATP-binding protein [Thermomicrobiales bacterium]
MAASSGAPPALSLRAVIVRYRDRVALDVARLDIAPGERVAIVGPNGAGKTTLLHVAGLLLDPASGEIRLSGELATPRASERLRRETALVLQQPALFAMSALDNAALGLRLRGAGAKPAREIAAAWLGRFGVGHLADRRPATLSGGEAQRIALARAFAVSPRLLLLDEPFSSLDPASRAALLPALADALAESGAAAVLVTHDLREAAAFGRRLGVLLAGRLAQIGPPGETLARPATLAAAKVLGVDNLLPGTARRSGGGWVFQTDGDALTAPIDHAGEGVTDGGRSWLAVRAGAVRVVESGGIPARIVAVETTPDGWLVRVDRPVPLVALAPWGAAAPSAGQAIGIDIPRALGHLVAE